MLHLNRREFIYTSMIGMAGLSAGVPIMAKEKNKKSVVALIRTDDRKKGVADVMNLLKFSDMKGKKVFIKPNFNTADPAPGSTHNDVLTSLFNEVKNRDAISVTVGDRCGPGNTKKVMEDKGIFDLGSEQGFDVINFEELDDKDWLLINPPGSHWKKRFLHGPSFSGF